MPYSPGLTLITCTGGRPEPFALCARYVRRQTWRGPLQWIVVNDVDAYQVATDRCPPGSLTSLVFPVPRWRPGQNTLARNLLAALPVVCFDKVLFFEDDDWYSPAYAAEMAGRLDRAGIAGTPVSLYYHLSGRYREMRNTHSASLCQTGLRAEHLPVLEQVCRESSDFIDGRLWQRLRAQRDLAASVPAVIGIKGLPGRPGIGVGHRPEQQPHSWTADPDGRALRTWIGDDTALYAPYRNREDS